MIEITKKTWNLFKGTKKQQSFADEAACIAGAQAAGPGKYSCRGKVDVLVTDEAPAPVPAPAPTPAPVPAPSPTPPAGADINAGLIFDKLPRLMSKIPKPAKGQTILCPEFGKKITRITDSGGGGCFIKPAYATVQAWNSDESLLILYHTADERHSVTGGQGHHLYDGRTYQWLRKLDDMEPKDIEHFCWSSKNPDLVVFPYCSEQSGSWLRQLIELNVRTGQKTVVADFNPTNTDREEVSFGSDPMYSSFDNDLFGLYHSKKGAFTYRRSTGQTSRYIPSEGNAAQIAPSGKFYLVNGDLYESTGHSKVRKMKLDCNEHACMVRLADGRDALAAVQFDAIEATLAYEVLETGEVVIVVGPSIGYPYPPTGTHLSALSFARPGHVAVSCVGDCDGSGLLDQEILLVELSTKKAYRVAHHHSAGGDGQAGYWAEPHLVMSPSGTRILFGSDWHNSNSVDAYVVELAN